jgi:hypothetical protein
MGPDGNEKFSFLFSRQNGQIPGRGDLGRITSQQTNKCNAETFISMWLCCDKQYLLVEYRADTAHCPCLVLYVLFRRACVVGASASHSVGVRHSFSCCMCATTLASRGTVHLRRRISGMTHLNDTMTHLNVTFFTFPGVVTQNL